MNMTTHELRSDYAAFEAWDEDQHNDDDSDVRLSDEEERYGPVDKRDWGD